MVSAALAIDYNYLRDALARYDQQVRGVMGPSADGKDRPIHNHAVALLGLEFLGAVLRQIFGERYDGNITTMQESMLANLDHIVPENMSEASRVLDILARLTREEDVQYKLEKNRDYTLSDTHVDIRLKNVYPKYVRYVRSLGQDALYDSQAAFLAAMTAYPGVTDTYCSDNAILRASPFDVVYRFSAAYFEKEKIEHFS